MCMECHSNPCRPGCPNAPDPETVYHCKTCGEPIVVGNEYCEYCEDYYHESCFRDAALGLLAEDGAKLINGTDYDETVVGVCPYCGDKILREEDRWMYDGKLYHDDCMYNCADSLLEDYTRRGVAQNPEPDYDPYDD